MKFCKGCNNNLETLFFGKHKRSKDGLYYLCKSCTSIEKKIYYQKNKESIKAKQLVRNSKDKNKKKRDREYHTRNRDRILEKQAEYRNNNLEKISEAKKRCYENKKEEYLFKGKTYREENREKRNKHSRERSSVDIQFKLANNLRKRMSKMIHGINKSGSAVKDLGCSVEEFKIYLESLFQPGMSWANYGNGHGYWNIDHKTPLSVVDLTNREEFLKVCHYTNLQPMWAIENIKKGNKISLQEEKINVL
jgi:hypothetical protein